MLTVYDLFTHFSLRLLGYMQCPSRFLSYSSRRGETERRAVGDVALDRDDALCRGQSLADAAEHFKHHLPRHRQHYWTQSIKCKNCSRISENTEPQNTFMATVNLTNTAESAKSINLLGQLVRVGEHIGDWHCESRHQGCDRYAGCLSSSQMNIVNSVMVHVEHLSVKTEQSDKREALLVLASPHTR